MSDSTNPLTPQEPLTPQSEPTPQLAPATPPRGFKAAILKNWKTTSIGLVLSFTGFVAFSPETFGGADKPFVQVCRYVTSGGLAALGISSKDYNVTGGS